MKYHKKEVFFVITLFLMLLGCSQTKQLSKNELNNILNKSTSSWTIEECNKIINLATISNAAGFNSGTHFDDVFIRAQRLDYISIPALARKESILKRLSREDYLTRLLFYLEDYTNHTFDSSKREIVMKDIVDDSLKGISFEITFQNVSNPYRAIDVEEGYDYFFLEDNEGEYCRVSEISGDYADDHFILSDYMNVVVTFSSKTDNGKLLFPNDTFTKKYKLIFNGLQKNPIILE